MDLKLSGQLPAGQGDSTFFGALAAALAAGACAGWVARGGSCDRGSGDSGGRDSSGSNGSSSGSEVCTAAVHFNTFPYNTAVQNGMHHDARYDVCNVSAGRKRGDRGPRGVGAEGAQPFHCSLAAGACSSSLIMPPP